MVHALRCAELMALTDLNMLKVLHMESPSNPCTSFTNTQVINRVVIIHQFQYLLMFALGLALYSVSQVMQQVVR